MEETGRQVGPQREEVVGEDGDQVPYTRVGRFEDGEMMAVGVKALEASNPTIICANSLESERSDGKVRCVIGRPIPGPARILSLRRTCRIRRSSNPLANGQSEHGMKPYRYSAPSENPTAGPTAGLKLKMRLTSEPYIRASPFQAVVKDAPQVRVRCKQVRMSCNVKVARQVTCRERSEGASQSGQFNKSGHH